MYIIAVRVRAKVPIQSSLSARTKRGDGTMQQNCLWHRAIPDVLPILSHVCCISWRVPAAAGEHSRRRSGDENKGIQPHVLLIIIVDSNLFFFLNTGDHTSFLHKQKLHSGPSKQSAHLSQCLYEQTPSHSLSFVHHRLGLCHLELWMLLDIPIFSAPLCES